MDIQNEMELRILNWALLSARFNHNDYDSKDYYASPFTGAIHKKIVEELREKFSTKWKYYPDEKSLSIESYPNYSVYMESIKKHISNIDNWLDLSLEIKKEVVQQFIYPFTLDEKNFEELVHYNPKK